MIKKVFVVLLLAAQLTIHGQSLELAKTPPMGWNSWNAFALNINSKIVKAVADSMVSKGLAAAGYQYIVIDDGWQISRDSDGRIIADTTRFPEGIKYLADYVHSKGLKFGIYTCCGTKTCGGRPGSYGYESIDAKTYAEWGVDYIKEDWCFTDGLDTRTQYRIMSEAIKATGRPMLLSLCEWGTSSPWEWGKGVGSLWRTTSDIVDCFDCVYNWGGMGFAKILDKNAGLAPYAGPGHWNDPDMLEVGNKALTPTECRSHFALWCMMAAPLIAGNNISTMNDTIRDILTAPEIIAIDQDSLGVQGTRIRNDAGLQVWQKPLADGSIAVALLNLSASSASQSVTLEEIGLKKGIVSTVRDLWNRKDLPAVADSFQAEVDPHGVVVVKIKGEKVPPSSLKFEQPSIGINKGNHTRIHAIVLPSTAPLIVTSSNVDVVSLSPAGINVYQISAKEVGGCVIKATTADGSLSASCNVYVEPPNIPVPWKFEAIKDNKASAVYENGIFSIEGDGADIWGASDQFAYVNREVEKDSFISARVLTQTNTDPWAKTGLMMRESVAPNSKFVMLCVTPGNGISLQWRDSTGGICHKKDFDPASLPVFLKLERRSSLFSAFKSTGGSQWEPLGDIALKHEFNENYLAGMEVVSHSSHLVNLSKFDQVKVGQVIAKKNR
jgi:alpha-galactosidase